MARKGITRRQFGIGMAASAAAAGTAAAQQKAARFPAHPDAATTIDGR